MSTSPGSQLMARISVGPLGSPRKLLSFIGFNVGWFACVLGAAHGWGWAGPLAVALLFGLHLVVAPDPRGELRTAAAAVGIGAVLDSSFGLTGVLVFAANPFPVAVSPPWILALWVNFGAGLRSSMSWLTGRPLLGAMMGAVAGPAAYYAAARLGAVSFGVSLAAALGALAVAWAIAVPLLGVVARREK